MAALSQYSDAELYAAAGIAPPQAPQHSLMEDIGRYGTLARKGATQGILGSTGDTLKYLSAIPAYAVTRLGGDAGNDAFVDIFGGKDPSDYVRQIQDTGEQNRTGSITTPENALERGVSNTSEFIGSALPYNILGKINPSFAASTGKGLLALLGAGGGNSVGKEVAPDSPLAQIALTLLGAATPSAVRGIASGSKEAAVNAKRFLMGSSTEEEAARAAAQRTAKILGKEGINPVDVAARMGEADAAGIPITLPEASKSSTLLARQKVIERGAGEGANILREFKADRPGQIRDALGNFANAITTQADDIADPLYKNVGKIEFPSTYRTESAPSKIIGLDKEIKIEIPNPAVKELLSDPVIGDAVKAFGRNKKLSYRVQDLPKNSVGYFNEVKKYLNAQGQLPSTDKYLSGIYGDAAKKITNTLDQIAPDYAKARAAAQPGIVARNEIQDALGGTRDNSIGVLRNRIFGSPDQRRELQRGLGQDNYKNLGKLMGYVDDAIRGSSADSGTAFNQAAQKELAQETGAAGVEALGRPLNIVGRFADWYSNKVREKDYKALANLYTSKDLAELGRQLKGVSKADSASTIAGFLESKLPAVGGATAAELNSSNGQITKQSPVPTVTAPGEINDLSKYSDDELLKIVGEQPVTPLVPAPEASQQSSIDSIIKKAATATGVDSNLLQAIASSESNLDPNARAETSSASGLFQITKPTFRKLIDKYGKPYGITMRDVFNPEANAIMAAHLTAENSNILGKALGREVTPGESYIAHFLGPRAAAVLLQADPNKPAAKLFPQAAKANRSIFFDTSKALVETKERPRARTAGEVAYLLASKVESKMPQVDQAIEAPQEILADASHVPPEAAAELKKNPKLSAQFEEVFGPGTAIAILKQ